MGLSIIKRIKLFPGLSLNLSTSGVSLSAGPSGAKINRKMVGKQAGKTTFYAGKYGVRYNKMLNKNTKKRGKK